MEKLFVRLKEERNREDGFTLSELIVVIALLAILIVISLPIYNTIRGASRQAAVDATSRSAYSLVQAALYDGDPTTDPATIADELDTANIYVTTYLGSTNNICAYAEWLAKDSADYKLSESVDPGCYTTGGTPLPAP